MAKANVTSPVQMQLTVNVPPQAYEFLQKNANGDVSGTLAQWCIYYLDRQARGGLFLEPEDHERVAVLNDGKRFATSRQLTRAIEVGLRREETQYTFKINVDPTDFPVIQEYAVQQGTTPEQLIQGAADCFFHNGWLYDFCPENGTLMPFTRQMLDQLCAISGKANVNSEDVIAAMRELVELRSQTEPVKAAA